ncbi:helix-turn-helix domain-containing protein [Marivita cryptomonadis]|jgi:hypothetical protein|uniref:helix-turn-helix domain-containing protein n=1 Tax=Marivita cryptomonadis TaxID=505252 RepID=UPI001C3958FA|nr:helix-turn-helix domain-containing protein [Marivita cryptomonadis]
MSSTSQPIGVIAKLLDLSERRVQQLSREGVIPKVNRGQYDLIGFRMPGGVGETTGISQFLHQ